MSSIIGFTVSRTVSERMTDHDITFNQSHPINVQNVVSLSILDLQCRLNGEDGGDAVDAPSDRHSHDGVFVHNDSSSIALAFPPAVLEVAGGVMVRMGRFVAISVIGESGHNDLEWNLENIPRFGSPNKYCILYRKRISLGPHIHPLSEE